MSQPRLPVDVLPIRICPDQIEASEQLMRVAKLQEGDALISYADSSVVYGRTGPSDHLEVQIHLSVPVDLPREGRARYSILYGKS